jgi:rubrerythrin
MVHYFHFEDKDIGERLQILSEHFQNAEQCEWICPLCGERCEGIKGHKGYHQCPTHLIVGER